MKKVYLTVIELPHYLRRAERLLKPGQMAEIVRIVARDPEIGTVIPGGGGIRKFRYAYAQGKGKSGGARVVYLAVTVRGEVYLLDLYAKNEKDDLTRKQLGDMEKLARLLKEDRI